MHENNKTSKFQLVQKNSFKNKYDSTILVSTIDGYLSAIDASSGEVKWRYKEGI